MLMLVVGCGWLTSEKRWDEKKFSLNGSWVRVEVLHSCHVVWELASTGFGMEASKGRFLVLRATCMGLVWFLEFIL
jgi:hypothetical protein